MDSHHLLAHQPIAQLLIDKGIIGKDQLRIAAQELGKSAQPLEQLLVHLGFVTESTLRDVQSQNIGQTSLDLATVIIDPSALALIPHDVARRYQLLPVSLDRDRKNLTLATADPGNILALDQLRALLKNEYQLHTQFAEKSDVQRAIDQHYGLELSIDGILHEIEPHKVEQQSLQLDANEFSQPVVRLVDALLSEAVQQGASDIHFEPEASFLRIRYRVDGVLRQVRSLHRSFWPSMVVRIKVMAAMNIAETRAPQDGHISLRLYGRAIDFRVASHPTSHGENLVLRILDRQKGIVPISQLGLDELALSTLRNIIAKPEGIILLTGPTGSGKTTTLYSVLNHINNESVNIMTLEDPVEYPVPLIRQSSVNESAKLDFASGIRSMMRQDPDIILVGEIRDHATAEMAFRAAMTGHQVYSTLHTNSAIGAIPRLLDIGILPGILAGNITGIIAQRLIRMLCPQCKTGYRPDDNERELLGMAQHDDRQLFRAVGCSHCHQQGYRGRRAIMEIFKMDSGIDDLIMRHASIHEIKLAALEKGFRPLAQDGIRRILLGETSVAEVMRVVDLGDRLT